MTDPKLGRRYADALYEAARDEGVVEEVMQAADELQRVFEESGELRRVWDAPQIPGEKKTAIVGEVFKGAPELLLSSLHVLLEKKRDWVLPDMIAALRERHDREAGIVRGTLTTAIELEDKEVSPFIDLLSKRTGGDRVEIDRKVNPDLIAGFTLRWGTQFIDASVSRALRDIRRLAGA
ncbi:ATP synthase F1 subunit delta [bacterium]|nr:ATP synthase F1 subunit delta [bacterium]